MKTLSRPVSMSDHVPAATEELLPHDYALTADDRHRIHQAQKAFGQATAANFNEAEVLLTTVLCGQHDTAGHTDTWQS